MIKQFKYLLVIVAVVCAIVYGVVEAGVSDVKHIKAEITHVEAQRFLDNDSVSPDEVALILSQLEEHPNYDIDRVQEFGIWSAAGIGFDKNSKRWFVILVYNRTY